MRGHEGPRETTGDTREPRRITGDHGGPWVPRRTTGPQGGHGEPWGTTGDHKGQFLVTGCGPEVKCKAKSRQWRTTGATGDGGTRGDHSGPVVDVGGPTEPKSLPTAPGLIKLRFCRGHCN